MSFIARFESDCENCDAPVEKEQEAKMIDYRKGLVAHVTCPASSAPQPVCSSCWMVHGLNQKECE